MPGERLPLGRRVAATEPLRVGQLKAALGEEVPRRSRDGSVQPVGVELCGRLVRGKQPTPLAVLMAGYVTALLIGQLDAGPGGEMLDGLGEGEVVDLLHEPDDVAAIGAGEAVPQATGRGHVEGRGLLVVERAQPLERAATGVAELEVFTDHIGDGRLLADHRDVLVADPACHSHPSLQRSRPGESSLRCPQFAGPPNTRRGPLGGTPAIVAACAGCWCSGTSISP